MKLVRRWIALAGLVGLAAALVGMVACGSSARRTVAVEAQHGPGTATVFVDGSGCYSGTVNTSAGGSQHFQGCARSAWNIPVANVDALAAIFQGRAGERLDVDVSCGMEAGTERGHGAATGAGPAGATCSRGYAVPIPAVTHTRTR